MCKDSFRSREWDEEIMLEIVWTLIEFDNMCQIKKKISFFYTSASLGIQLGRLLVMVGSYKVLDMKFHNFSQINFLGSRLYGLI